MKKTFLSKFILSALALALPCATAWAHESHGHDLTREGGASENLFYAELVLGASSADVWRGMVQNDEPVWQPHVMFGIDLKGYGKVYGDVLFCFDATTRNRQTTFGGLNAIDYWAGYEVELGDFVLGAGHIWYTYPKANGPDYEGSAREIFAKLSYKNAYVVPFIEGYYDYNVAEGIYALAGLRKEVQVADPLSVGAEVSVGGGSGGMTRYYFDGRTSKTGLTDGNAELFAKYDLTDNLFLGARVAWTSLLDDRLKGVWFRDHTLWGGIEIGMTF
ncbi:MAG: hypothetical protein FWH21_02910 [Kiritimatiellaeota bacterium]|nr:hypothetical protein [Kiritimatiellota bacterium]